MVLKNVENIVAETGNIEQFLGVVGRLKDPTKQVLPFALDIGAYLSGQGLGNEYAFFGGYAVLSHLMAARSKDIASFWRGSDDVDMAGSDAVLRSLKIEYLVSNDRVSPNLEDKRTLKVDLGGYECKVDFYNGDYQTRFGPIESNEHFGVKLNVINPISLIKSKLLTPVREIIHSGDIARLVGVIEHRGIDPKEVTKKFSPSERAIFLKRLKEGYEHILQEGLEIDMVPTRSYKKELAYQLGRGKDII